jgi:crotonobetainyl-CoA:carnitine CoA-transferase CaiB-like acyl-CoA transferase
MTRSRPGALAGVFVLDLSRVLAGPWATQLLADLGADVVKVERPRAGDDTRAWGPPFTTRADGEPGDAAYFFAANRNKRSLAVDMSKSEGAYLLRRLAEQADVLVENFRTGGLEKYGLDYGSLAAANPKLVYCSITGFGHTGPLKDRAGYDYMIQAMGGLMSITGQPDGAPGAEPMKVGVAVADLFTGLYASNAILAALLHARATGAGQHIDMALFDAQAAMLANQATNYFVSGAAPQRMGNAHPNLAPYQPFRTADGEIVIAVGNELQFRALCRALGEEALADDPRFRTNADRVTNRTELIPILEARTRSLPAAQWIEALEPAGVPCGPVNTVEQVFAEPHAAARELVVEQRRDDLTEPVRTVASPLRLSRTPPSYDSPPPALGAHTEEVLSERLGLSSSDIAELREAGAV